SANLTRIDATSGRVVGHAISFAGPVEAIDVASGSVWVAMAGPSSSKVYQVDAATGRVRSSFPVPGATPFRPLLVRGRLWVTLMPNTSSTVRLAAFDPKTGARLTSPMTVGDMNPFAAAGSLWAAGARGGVLLRIDPHSGRVLGRISVGDRPADGVSSAGVIWVAEHDGSIVRIDLRPNRIVGGPTR